MKPLPKVSSDTSFFEKYTADEHQAFPYKYMNLK